MFFNRSSQSLLSKWWYTVDLLSLFFTLMLIAIGIIACATASPSVAATIGVESFFFLKKHLFHAILAIFFMAMISLLKPSQIKLLSLPVTIFFIILLATVPFIGTEIKGAKRWISLLGIHMQPSELIRPWLAVLSAWLLQDTKGFMAVALLQLLVTAFLLLQPDVGMTMMIASVWIIQLFMSNLPVALLIGALCFFLLSAVVAYISLPHVQQRVLSFFSSSNSTLDHYQISKSMEAFKNGGLLGQGPGQGTAKNHIPDGHADFIFAVIGEEFGLMVCVFVLALFLGQACNSIMRVRSQDNNLNLCIAVALVSQMQIQIILNIGVVTRLLPTTGVTLPFISYGGSSMLASGITMGLLLAFTRQDAKQLRLSF